MTGKKLVNCHCTTRKTVLGDKFLTISLQTKVGKDNQVVAYDPKKKVDKRKPKVKLNNNSAAVIKKPNTDKGIPVEPIKRVNLTGFPDDELFGPAFLYEETEFYTGKKVISANPVKMNLEPNYSSDYEDEYDVDEEIQCTFCGIGILPHEEQDHIDALHKEEYEALGEDEDPMYTPPEIEATEYTISDYEVPRYPTLKNEAPDANEIRKLTREVRDINGAMNDLSSSTMNDIRAIKKELSELNKYSTKEIEALDDAHKHTVNGVSKDIHNMDLKIDQVQATLPEYIDAVNRASTKLGEFDEDIKKIKTNENSFKNRINTVQKNIEELKQFQKEEKKEIQIKVENMEEIVNTLQINVSNKKLRFCMKV